MKKSAEIASITGKGYYVDPNIQDIKFLYGIYAATKFAIPYRLLVAVDPNITDVDYLELEQIFSEF
jgi:hypothetical protein